MVQKIFFFPKISTRWTNGGTNRPACDVSSKHLELKRPQQRAKQSSCLSQGAEHGDKDEQSSKRKDIEKKQNKEKNIGKTVEKRKENRREREK